MAKTFKDYGGGARGRNTKARRHENRRDRRQGERQVREEVRSYNAQRAQGRQS